MKKVSKKKGVAIITSLGVCFVLLALGTVLMVNSYAHMNMAQKFHHEADALNIAEAGVNYEVYMLEQIDFNLINDGNEPVIHCGRGTFKVERAINKNNPDGRSWEGLVIPRYCIGIKSTAIVNKYKKVVKTVVGNQLVPYTVCSEGTIRMNVGNNEIGGDPVTLDPNDPPISELNSFTAVVDSIDGFRGNMHSNYDSPTEATYRCTSDTDNHVYLTVEGGTLSTHGIVGTEAEEKINANGGTAVSGAQKKKFITTDYETLYKKAEKTSEFISLDDKVPWPVKFKGKLRNNGGDLEAYTNLGWLELDSWYGDFTPDGMEWKSGVLVIDEGKNYTWKDDLELKDVSISVKGNKGSTLFVNGNITANNIEITADAFGLASNDKKIILNDARLNITASATSDGVALYTKDLVITTDKAKIPAGGNNFKGIVYANGGVIDLTNQYDGIDPNTNRFKLEGLVINPQSDPGVTPCLKVKNKGHSSFNIDLKYNPYVANALIDYTTGKINLQPLYWQIE